jgi:hypothetical protein
MGMGIGLMLRQLQCGEHVGDEVGDGWKGEGTHGKGGLLGEEDFVVAGSG